MQINLAALFCVDNMDEMAVFFDRKGNILFANAKAKQSTEYGENIFAENMETVFPGVLEIMEREIPKKHAASGEPEMMSAYRKNRTCFPVMAKLFWYPEENVCLCIAYDATEKQLLQNQNERIRQEVEKANKTKSEFVANITHELRTPVNGILGNTRQLAELETDGEKQKLLSLIERGCADMNAIINNILDFSKLEAGKFTLEPRRFRFRDTIDYVKANHKNKITEKGLDFTVTVAPDIPEELIGDELRLIQILNNLLSNACKFTSVGRITLNVVRTSQVNDRIELFFLVSDTGIGIDKAGQDKLFKSFSQVDASTSRRFGGTGLGLNISKQLVELMGGDIHVESEPGHGSLFSFHVWLEVPQEELVLQRDKTPELTAEDVQTSFGSLHPDEHASEVWTYGTEENLGEIRKKASKLILCVEMDNWEKAEGFADVLRHLTEQAPREIKNAVLRLKMAVQKADYGKTEAAYEKLKAEIGID
jgi:nitrogen-specific signal transduction histidine kinase